jgi:hypothetical protein
MELDELKETWKQSSSTKTTNADIMEMIQHKSHGPIAALKREFRKQMIVMCILPIILLITNLDDVHRVFTSIMFWSYTAFCVGLIAFAFNNYRITGKMERMDGMVRANLEQQIAILQTRLRWLILGLRIALLYFIFLAEVVPYFQHYRMLDLWHSFSPFVRFGTYALLLILQYFLSGRTIQRKFGDHLIYLKELARDMEY